MINKIFNGKQGEKIFLNIDEYEYPRSNETLRQIHKQHWLDYYKCLKETYAYIGREKMTYPIAIIRLEGTSVTLKCEICISPVEMRMTDLIEWYFNSSSKNNIVKSIVEETEHVVRSQDNQYIIMYNLKLEQAGLYWCEMGNTAGSPYYLHIDNDFEAINIVYPNEAIYAPQAAPAQSLPEYDLKFYTTWTKWSSCSKCNMIGIKFRYGYCTVALSGMSEYINENALISNESKYMKREAERYEWNETVESTTQMMINESLQIQLRMALLLFRNSMPCKSSFIPKQIQIIPAIKNRKTEIMRRYCKKKCRKNVIFEVRDEKGKVLESANNSAGIYSMIQGMPKLLPTVMRNVIYAKRTKKLKLICPGNLNEDMPITWQIDDKIIIASHIKNQSKGRIYINPQMHIIFQSLKFEDANIYSCWQSNELAGVIKLNVSEEIGLKVNQHIILIGAVLIISVFLTIFWRAFKGRTRYTIH